MSSPLLHETDSLRVQQADLAVCSPKPVSQNGLIRIGFSSDTDLPTKTDFRRIFQETYNDVSPKCNEVYERQIKLPDLLEVRPRDDDSIDTFWSADVMCYPECQLRHSLVNASATKLNTVKVAGNFKARRSTFR